MSTIVTRAGKGTPLTNNEVDANFVNLNTDKVEKAAAAITGGSIDGTTVGASSPSSGAFTSLTSNSTTTLNGTTIPASKTLLVTTDIDVTVQGYDADTTKNDVANTFTAAQTMSSQLNLTNDADYNLYASGAGNNYMAGSLGIGATPAANYNLVIGKNITGSVLSYSSFVNGTIQSDVTSVGASYVSSVSTAAASFTLGSIRHFWSGQATIGAGSTVTSQYGFFADANLVGATSNYGFFSNIAAATGRWGFYSAGTANNYLAGNLGIGSTGLDNIRLRVGSNATGGTTAHAIASITTGLSDVTANFSSFYSQPSTQATTYTLSNLYHYNATLGTIGAGSTVTSQYGFFGQNNLTGATNNYAFFSNIAAATGRYSLYMNGTAANYMAGQLAVGTTNLTSSGWAIISPTQSSNTYQMQVSGTNTNTGASIGGLQVSPTFTGTIATTNTFGLLVQPTSTVATGATYSQMVGVYVNPLLNNTTIPNTISAVSAVPGLFSGALGGTIAGVNAFIATPSINASATTNITTWVNFYSTDVSNGAAQTVTNVYGFYGLQSAGANRYNLYMAGTANNYLAGSLGIGSTAITGYGIKLTLNLTGSTNSIAMRADGTVQSDATVAAQYFNTSAATAAASFTVPVLYHFSASQATFGAGSTVTTQVGFNVNTTPVGGTNNYSFRGQLAAATSRYNLYMDGTASNYLAGTTLIGTLTNTLSGQLVSSGQIIETTGSTQYNIVSQYDIGTNANQIPLNQYLGSLAYQNSESITGGSATFTGRLNLTNATDYNLYASGIGPNYLAGRLGIGVTPATNVPFYVVNQPTGSTFGYGLAVSPTYQSDVTSNGYNYQAAPSTAAASFTLGSSVGYFATQGVLGAGSAITNNIGFYAATLTNGTNNRAFQGAVAAATGAYNLFMNGTADNYLAGRLTIGSAGYAQVRMGVSGNITGNTNSYAYFTDATVQSDVTSAAAYYATNAATQATAFTCGNIRHFQAIQGAFGAGSAVSNQVGLLIDNTLVGATNNYGIYLNLAAATGRYNIYVNGTADNYLAGGLGIGTTTLTGYSINIAKTITGATSGFGIRQTGQIQSDVTTAAYGVISQSGTQAASFTLGALRHFQAGQGTFGASSAVTTQVGFRVEGGLTGATNNWGFQSEIAAATGAYNLYMSGTANNYLAGSLGVGVIPTVKLHAVTDGEIARFDRGSNTQYISISSTTSNNQITATGANAKVFAIYNSNTNSGSNLDLGTNNTSRFSVTYEGNFRTTSSTSTTMSNGFIYIPAAGGAPTGVPTAVAGSVPMYYDSTNNQFYIYNGAWKKVALA